MKKLLFLMPALVLGMALAGCGGKGNNSSSATSGSGFGTSGSQQTSQSSDKESESESESQQTGALTYTCTSLPEWITNDDCVIFAWAWSENDTGSWKSGTFGDAGTSLSFEAVEELQGFLLVRCIAETTAPDWSTKENVPGRIYNQTEDIACETGVYSYECASWKEYNP